MTALYPQKTERNRVSLWEEASLCGSALYIQGQFGQVGKVHANLCGNNKTFAREERCSALISARTLIKKLHFAGTCFLS
jgi:hypothetical protein